MAYKIKRMSKSQFKKIYADRLGLSPGLMGITLEKFMLNMSYGAYRKALYNQEQKTKNKI